MEIGITGGTGFMGTHLARRLVMDGHQPVLISRSAEEMSEKDLEDAVFISASVSDECAIRDAIADCDAVAHLAGINMERGTQTYEAVHVRGTRNLVEAAETAGVSKILLSSFLRARPNCGSAYHESKWAAEEIVRSSGLDYTVLKPGVTYGRGDHMLSHVARALMTVPVFGLVGFRNRRLRPLAIEDLVDVMVAALINSRLTESTVAVTGPEQLTLREAIGRIGDVIGQHPIVAPTPVHLHYGLAWAQERVMETPITTRAQVRILEEEVVEPAPGGVCSPLPNDLQPRQPFTKERIRGGLPALRPYGIADLQL